MRTATRRATVYGGRRVPQFPTIAGLQLWLKADAITGLSDGDALTTWADSSSNGRNATQATAGAKPTYKTGIIGGKPVARFDGGDRLEITAPTILRNVAGGTFFAVAKASDTAATKSVFIIPTNAAGTGRMSVQARATVAEGWTAGGRQLDANSFQSVTNATNAANFTVLSSVFDYANSNLYLWCNRGTPASRLTFQANGNTSDTDSATLCVGDNGLGTGYMTGDIAEIIVYDSALSDANRQAVEAYLSAKYGIALA